MLVYIFKFGSHVERVERQAEAKERPHATLDKPEELHLRCAICSVRQGEQLGRGGDADVDRVLIGHRLHPDDAVPLQLHHHHGLERR